VLLVGRGSSVVYRKAYGQRALEPIPEPMTVDTIFDLASLTKPIATATAVMQLVEDGRLRLDDRVANHLPDFGRHGKDTITVRHLLTHVSGLRGDLDLEDPWVGRDTALALAAEEIPLAAPGERFIYGPSSFYVFGELMRRKLTAAGTGDADIVAYLDRRVFRPLGIAPRFLRDEAGNANLPGGCRVSARDWAVFGEMVRRGGVHVDAQGHEVRILDQAGLDELLRPHGPNVRYGLTWWLLRPGDADPEDAIAADLAADRLDAAGNGPIRRAMRDRLRARAEAAIAADAAEHTEQPISGYMAAGKGKQRLYVIPEHGLTIVRFGDINGGRDFSDARFLELVREGLELPSPQR